jgi:hypothetical protein
VFRDLELDSACLGACLNLDPVVGVLTAVSFLGEPLNAGQVLGGAVALAGMWLATDQGPRDRSSLNRLLCCKGEMGTFLVSAIRFIRLSGTTSISSAPNHVPPFDWTQLSAVQAWPGIRINERTRATVGTSA